MFKTMLLSIILYLVAVCGFSDGSATDEVGSPLQPKIIGGRNASENQFPFVVSILYKRRRACTGTIITRKFILTAGHCVKNKRREDITVKAGFDFWEDKNAIFRDVRGIRVHPQYRIHNRTSFDIALVKMRHPLAYNRAIEPVTIPAFRQKLPVGTKATFVGWGLTQFQPYIISPPILQALDVTTISRQDCKYFWLYLDINTICVSSETSSAIPFKGACRCCHLSKITSTIRTPKCSNSPATARHHYRICPMSYCLK
ncbi:serine protease 46-like isoform X2 [Periplaneta americana]|uniref:serine protease 46-like isoform X2 n=1 Tax=Periplaneta americana TaxID=6978 RepID=UPI0037E87A4F